MDDNFITITCIGDIAPAKSAESAIMADIAGQKRLFEAFFAGSDVVFGNLEAPLTTANTPTENKKYILKAEPRVLDAFPDKFVFSLANNHILDYGHDGLLETMACLSKKGFRFTGAGENLEAAGKPVIIDCTGKKIGFLAAAGNRYDNRNLAATENKPGIWPANPDLLHRKIIHLKKLVNLVYVSIHMGMEYIPVPTPGMLELAKTCHQAGAQVVFFHHAHCVSGYTAAQDSITLWGTGNFLFPDILDYPFTPWFESAAWTIRHHMPENRIDVITRPFTLDGRGLPRKAGAHTGDKIVKRIDYLGGKINETGAPAWLRLIHMGKPAYLRLLVSNYSDIARRKGLPNMAGQILSAIKHLFLTKT